MALPDYQGLGIGGRLKDWMGQYLYDRGYRHRSVVAHPAMIRHYAASPRWREVTGARRTLATRSRDKLLRSRSLTPRSLGTRSFEYVSHLAKDLPNPA